MVRRDCGFVAWCGGILRGTDLAGEDTLRHGDRVLYGIVMKRGAATTPRLLLVEVLRNKPTNGVTEDDVDAWLLAGAFELGFVGSLFDAEDLRLRRFEAITASATRLIAKVKANGAVALR